MAKLTNPLKVLLSKLPPMPSPPPPHDPRRDTLLQLSLLIGVAVFFHFQIANLSIALFALAIFILKTFIIIRKVSIPPRMIMIMLTIASLGMVIYVYGGWNGQRAGISFLILLASLKFLESYSLRDYYIVCLLLYFLGACSFLFNSSIVNIIIVLAFTLAITNILLQLSNPTKVPLKDSFKTSSVMVAKALPIAIILFFFFPRIDAAFGFLPSFDAGNKVSALSDRLVAGEMAFSAFNNELAFRVEFKDGSAPSRPQMYWRAKTMSAERNFQWEVVEPNGNDFNIAAKIRKSPNQEVGKWRYQILHEKSSDKYLPYLDYVSESNKGIRLPDYSVYKFRPGITAFSYEGSSTATSTAPKNRVAAFSAPTDIDSLLALDSKPNARLQLLLQQWRENAKSDSDMVKLVYGYFESMPFSYSIIPTSLDDNDPLNDFLFNTREGYCEHYASAFTIIMRMLGIPSRVVVGYQGGTPVNNNQFIEVRYSDAHAWSEVWVNNSWQRVDPTATISPERINYGMDALMELWNSGLLGNKDSGRALENLLNPTGFKKMFRSFQHSWKSASYEWNKWVVNYDVNAQRKLLKNLGVEHRNSVVILVLIMAISALSLLLLYFWQLVPRRIKRGEAQTHYLRFIEKFKRFKLVKMTSETPIEFAKRAASSFPRQALAINEITQNYYCLRYNKSSDEFEQSVNNFKRLVNQFKLKR